MCFAMVSIGGSEASSMSVSETEQSCRLAVLAKSARSRGVQWVLPPPTMAIFGVMGVDPMSGRRGRQPGR